MQKFNDMRKSVIVLLALFFSLVAIDASAQSWLKKIGNAVKTEVENQINNVTGQGQEHSEMVQQEAETPVAQTRTQSNQTNNGPTTGKAGGHEWVDLGLPSGTRWATCNVGATASHLSGKLYAWGETAVKSSYTEANCKFHNKAMKDIAGDKTYDVAAASWGGDWRMPTEAEFNELLNYCDWEYVQQGGRWGALLTSVKNGNSIFLPTTGQKYGTSVSNPNGCGHYWTSTPYKSTEGSHFYQFGAAEGYMNYGGRFVGIAVRPVLENKRVIETPSSGETNRHKWVDLGLPSGLKWATCNLGAKSPEQCGMYYEWGETTPITDKDSPKNEMYKKKIATIGGNTRYDAAKANWGNSWRMPSEEDFRELKDNCKWEWTEIGGRKGYKVTSKKNGNYIFLPAAGEFHDSNSDCANDIDSYGAYWTSTPEKGDYSYEAFALSFLKKSIVINTSDRFHGYCIRPVTK